MGQKERHVYDRDGNHIDTEIVTTRDPDYRELRAGEYPPVTDQLDAQFKQRQHQKMQAGKAKAALAAGDKDKAIGHLIDAIELVQDVDDVDGVILSVKARIPKPEAGAERKGGDE